MWQHSTSTSPTAATLAAYSSSEISFGVRIAVRRPPPTNPNRQPPSSTVRPSTTCTPSRANSGQTADSGDDMDPHDADPTDGCSGVDVARLAGWTARLQLLLERPEDALGGQLPAAHLAGGVADRLVRLAGPVGAQVVVHDHPVAECL